MANRLYHIGTHSRGGKTRVIDFMLNGKKLDDGDFKFEHNSDDYLDVLIYGNAFVKTNRDQEVKDAEVIAIDGKEINRANPLRVSQHVGEPGPSDAADPAVLDRRTPTPAIDHRPAGRDDGDNEARS